ncbi:MAG: nicotinamidase [Deltaproteobacteria bacterium]|nr:nicotinamidase [Deltaproteobacteria bacterium]
MQLALPSFYDPQDVAAIHLERAGLVAEEALRYRDRHGIKPAGQDRLKIAAFGIDCQIGFCVPGASLFVPGAVEDTRRTVEWLYRNLDRITGLHFSLDTHRVFQIFHPAWWADRQGHTPQPFTPITYDQVKRGDWTPIAHPKECLEYTRKLEESGRYTLTVWPFHTLLGGVSHALVPSLMEAAIFHSIARLRQTHFETKGTHAMTENYSVLSPEVTDIGGQSVGGFNAPFFKMLMEYDRIYVFGQAKSHCVLSTLNDIRSHIEKTDRNLAHKVYILEDATSPVPAPPINPLPPSLDFPAIAEKAFEELKRVGMQIVKTTDPII